VPCALVAGDELHEFAVAADQEMRRDAKLRNRCEGRMRIRIERVGEEPCDRLSAEFARRQRDSVHDDEIDRHSRRPRITIG